MKNLVLSVSLTSVLLFATAIPVFLQSKFRTNPAVGVTLWILSSIGLLASLLVSLAVGLVSVIDTYFALSRKAEVDQDFLSILLLSFIPWIALGLTGVLLALISMRLEPMVSNARRADETIQVFDSSKELFQGVQLIVLPVDAPIAFAKRIGGVGKIIVSSKTKSLLTSEELEAVLMHELQHLKRNHLVLKRITARLSSWLPWFIFTTTIHAELHQLLELDADIAAGKKIDLVHLSKARSKFVECL